MEIRPSRRSPSRRLILAAPLTVALRAQKAEITAFDFSLLDEWTVPAELFFIREHFAAPNVSAAGWKLAVDGAVTARVEISLDELTSLARRTLPVTIECAENPVGGGLVGHAEWTGVPLGALLEKARPNSSARFVRLTGADSFSRSIPLNKAAHPDTLLVTAMNGERLSASHGFPLRAVIPGWYGMDSVKWLRRVELAEHPDSAREYVRLTRSLLAGTRPAGAVTAMQVKSAFARPLDGAILTGRRFLIRGTAWAGERAVQRVEVSVDGAKSWQPARIESKALHYAWVVWTHEWRIPGPGQYELVVRAEDDAGTKQAAQRPADRADDYEWTGYQSVRVAVT